MGVNRGQNGGERGQNGGQSWTKWGSIVDKMGVNRGHLTIIVILFVIESVKTFISICLKT
jgi:hypothetical protein